MSQKVITKKAISKTSTKSSATSKPTISQAQTTKKTDERVSQKQNATAGKSVKTSANTVNTNNNKPTTGLTVNEVKKTTGSKTTVKAVGNKSTNSSTKPTIKSNTPVKQNLKPGVKNANLVRTNENTRREKTLVHKQNKQNVVTQNNSKNKIIETRNLAKEEQSRSPTETLKSQVSSQQNLLLATLETNASYKQYYGRSSESILAEPPSICEQELDETINNISDNRTEDYESDYYDDFEDYESDFEDDEEEDEEQDESQDEEYMKSETFDQDLDVSQYRDRVRSDYRINHDKSYNQNDIDSRLLEENSKTEATNRQTESRVESSFLSIADIKNAHLRYESKVHMNKAIERGNELLEIIKLNKIGFTNCDLPPINYDIFIRTFGRRDAKQVSCQTCEREDVQIQTESVIVNNKWTQNPSFTRIHAGSDDEENKIVCRMPNIDPFKLSKFLTKAETIMSAIIDCEFGRQVPETALPPGAEQFSSNYFVLRCLELAKKCPISYTFTNLIYLFCVQNVTKITGCAEKSVIVVWNLLSPKQPEKVLICRSHIVSGYSDDNIVVAAMIDGSVALWDLKEESHYHKQITIEQNKFILRSPSYNSAATGKGHNFAVVAINKITYDDFEDNSLHFATIDEMGFLIIWAINQVKGDANDFGVSPNSNWKLTRISVIETLKGFQFETSVKITTFECQPNDWSQFYCGTDNGLVIRCSRHEQSFNNLPKSFANHQINSFLSSVTKINFNKSEKSHFLVGYSDGFLSYYSITDENPLIIFDANHSPIIDVKWISDTNSTLIALNKLNQVFIWDLNNESIKPIVYYRHQNHRLLSLSLWKGIDSVLVFGSDCGDAFVFTLNHSKISSYFESKNG